MARSYDIGFSILTPLWMAGADQQKAELRSSSFRGAMRYWLRAALMAENPDPDVVRYREAEVFGDAGEIASSVNINVLKNPLNQLEKGRLEDFTLKNGLNYLLFSLRMGDNKSREFFLPNPKGKKDFSIRVALRSGASESAIRSVLGSLWLANTLGGFGTRSRRTAGSLQSKTAFGYLDYCLHGTTPQSVAESIKYGLDSAFRLMKVKPREGVNANAVSLAPSLHPNECKIWVLGVWNDWNDATPTVGSVLQKARVYPLHGDPILKWTYPSLQDRYIFGLPMRDANYRYKNGKKIERRASPLWITVAKTKENRYAVIATLFRSQFFPKDIIKNNVPIPDNFDLIEEIIINKSEAFTNDSRYQPVEVKYG